jgi:hypothetical protein
VVTVREKENFDILTSSGPEKDLWVLALNSLMNCRRDGHKHGRDEYLLASNTTHNVSFLVCQIIISVFLFLMCQIICPPETCNKESTSSSSFCAKNRQVPH